MGLQKPHYPCYTSEHLLLDRAQTHGGKGLGFGEVEPIAPTGPVNLHCELHPLPPLLLGLEATLSQRTYHTCKAISPMQTLRLP